MTIRQSDIAAMLGVSRATVWRALNDHPDVEEGLKARIKGLAEQMGYRPSYIAASLSGKQTRVISVMRPGLHTISDVHSRWLGAIWARAQSYGYRIRQDQMDEIDGIMAERSCDGFIMVTNQDSIPHCVLKHRGQYGRPVILTDCRLSPLDPDSVAVDPGPGTDDAISHLASLGHSNIGYYGRIDSLSVAMDRYLAYMRALGRNGLVCDPALTVNTPGWHGEVDDAHGFRDCILAAVSRGATAFLASSDTAALGLMKVLRRNGYRVPEDVSVIGYDNTTMAKAWDPGLSTVSPDIEGAGIMAVDMLLGAIRTGAASPGMVAGSSYVLRESASAVR